MHNDKTKEPLIHITKHKAMPWVQAWGIRLTAILIALIVCGFITTIATGLNPVEVYATMLSGAFGTSRRVWILLKELAILLCISLALTPAFRMQFWNLGGEGQILMGALATSACMITLGNTLPGPALIVVSLLAALAAGAVWGLIPAVFKARWNTNETLFTLMMNYVATQLVAYFVIYWEVPKGSGKIGIINQDSEAGWLPVIAGNRYLLAILSVAVLTVVMYIYLTRSKQGYEISVVGESIPTARYVGIKVSWTIIRTMIISGAICGFTGYLMVAGIDHTLTTTLAGGQGFTAVMVAWLAKFNPLGMILSSLLIVFLSRGAGEIATIFTLNKSYGDILTGIILFFIIGSEFFINYKLHFRGHSAGGRDPKPSARDSQEGTAEKQQEVPVERHQEVPMEKQQESPVEKQQESPVEKQQEAPAEQYSETEKREEAAHV